MITVSIYCYPQRPESQKLLSKIDELGKEFPLKKIVINLAEEEGVAAYFSEDAPVVQVGPYRLKGNFEDKELRVAISAAHDRANSLAESPSYKAQLQRGRTITKSDRFNFWFSKNYPIVFVIVLALYFGLAFLAPMLLMAGLPGPARVIYVIYKPFCHQLAFRSFFIGGEQAFYPRELAGIPDKITYEDLFPYVDTADDLLDARNFLGNSFTGYKIAICERCLAIYGSMLLFTILFWLTGRRIKSIPWYLWILFGMGPIGLDGGSQIPGLLGIEMPAWMIIRESTPFFRVLTGTLFGVSTFWYLLPQVENSMRESRMLLSKKFAYVAQAEKEDNLNGVH